MSDDDFTDIPEHRETCECLHTYTHIYVSLLLLLVKGYWCWHFQCKMLLLLFRYKFYMSLGYTKIIAEIFLPSNLLSIQRTNANAHISMNFWKKDARH